MAFFKLLLLLSSAACVIAQSFDWYPTRPPSPDCGLLNIVIVTLPPYNPMAKNLNGLNSTNMDKAIKDDAAAIRAAGYNLRVVLVGPDEGRDSLVPLVLDGTLWHGTVVGWGQRSDTDYFRTMRLQELVHLFREVAPKAPIIFDDGPGNSLSFIKDQLPVYRDCSSAPGKDLGTKEVCSTCVYP